jgi:ABC-2 type transport system ATP-binding protein
VIAAGEVVAEGTPDTLRGTSEHRTFIRFSADGIDLAALPLPAKVGDGVAIIETTSPTQAVNQVTSWALQRGLELDGLEVTRPSLEDVYLELTGGE